MSGCWGRRSSGRPRSPGLRQAAGFLRRALGQSLRLRYTPELVFTYDEGLEASDRVAQLLAEISRPGDAGSSEDDDE
jgi:ribosome-binding factor A